MTEVELPLATVAARHGDRGGAPEQGAPGRGRRARARGDHAAGARDLGARRDRVRDRLAAAARRGPLRAARPVAQAPRQDRLLDRRARAAGDPRRARDHPQDRALARAQPDPEDLPRRAAPARRRREPHPHDLPAGGRDDGTDRVDEPEHAERAGAHRARARDPRLLRGRARQRPDLGRLLAGRAARARPRRRRAGARGDLRARRGRPHRHRRPGLRQGPGRR